MNATPAIRLEGGLFGLDILEALEAGSLQGQKPQDFGLEPRRSLTDEIAAAFADARDQWALFQRRVERLPESDPATTLTRDAWVIPFLGLLGYELTYNPRAYEVDGLSFAVSHRASSAAEDGPPVHVVGARQELGRVAPSGRPRLSPHALVQEYLNRTEHLWGLVTNGLTLRLLRDCTFVRRQAYVEFDLTAILEEQRFTDFALLYRLLHRSRLPRSAADADASLLETYYTHAVEQGGRVRDRLRDGVEACLQILANGFLSHEVNVALRRRLDPACTGQERILPEELYRQLLRLVYRFLFLLVAEERGLIGPNPLYRDHYGILRLRRLLDRREAFDDHDDLWHALRLLWKVFRDERLAALLEVAPLNGDLFAPLDLDACALKNRDLLEAFRCLAEYRESPSAPPRRVNYAALDVEELGSVYESLLEYKPQVASEHPFPRFFLTQEGSERRSTGSYYTDPSLVEPLVRHALDPVLSSRLERATSAQQKEAALLSFRVCDPACGSGHFLLAAARRLGKELARVRTGEDEPSPEAIREALRDVVTHCLYGVDKNPLAVELCRVALWIEGHTPGKPLTFLDHRIRCGDSLLGVFDLTVLQEGIPDEAFKALAGDDKAAAKEAKRRNAAERRADLFVGNLGARLSALAAPLRAAEALPENSIEEVRAKERAYRTVESTGEFLRLRLACDVWAAAFFQSYPGGEAGLVTTATLHEAIDGGSIREARLGGSIALCAHRNAFFHWPLAFPEVFVAGGFDAVLGNPPFLGGLKLSGTFGDAYRRWLMSAFEPFKGTADLCAAFFRQGFRIVRPGGRVGLIATNTIGQGDTRESGLAPLLQQGAVLAYAKRFVKWPGAANVEVNLVAFQRPAEKGGAALILQPVLDEGPVGFISSRLDAEEEGEPKKLRQNSGKAFQGSIVLGLGFVLEPAEAEDLIARDPRNKDCLFPYLNGEDLNGDPEQRPSRWVINFFDWPLETAQQYPDLIRIVQDRVKPERERLRDSIPIQAKRKQFWWQYGSSATSLYRAIAPLRRVLVISRVTEHHAMVFVQSNAVFADRLVVFAFDDYSSYAILQSAIHEIWARRQGFTLESRYCYAPSDAFETFPFPRPGSEEVMARTAELGAAYHDHRRQIMLSRRLGLTKTYNLFHNPECTDEDIVRLRELHAEMDRAVLACYGWDDLDPQNGFHQNERGQTRFTISAAARRELLRRLLGLNLERAHESTE
ncbi:MAG: Eco57I restriction-modification methylase domain-containing protein [Acidobacteriota bacterium]